MEFSVGIFFDLNPESYSLLFSFLLPSNTELVIEIIKLNRKAQRNPSTAKPSSKASAISMIIALMKSRNIPKVKMVMGKVNKISNGFIKVFNSPMTMAAHTTVQKDS